MTTKLKYYGTKKKESLSSEEKTAIEDYKDRFSKWHGKQIDTLTFLANLIFTLSIGLAGFLLVNQDKDFFKDKTVWSDYHLIRTTLLLLISSSTIGIVAVISRYNDFRLTKDLIKVRRRIYELEKSIKYEDEKASDKSQFILKKENLICWTKFLGRLTKVLFYIQTALFLIVIWILALSV